MPTTCGPRLWTNGIVVLFTAATLSAAEPAPPKTEPKTEVPKASPPTAALQKLMVFPGQVTLDGPRDEHRLVVLGEYADCRRWDLSRDAKFISSAAAVATVEA